MATAFVVEGQNALELLAQPLGTFHELHMQQAEEAQVHLEIIL